MFCRAGGFCRSSEDAVNGLSDVGRMLSRRLTDGHAAGGEVTLLDDLFDEEFESEALVGRAEQVRRRGAEFAMKWRAFGLRSQGFTWGAARTWVEKEDADRRFNSTHSLAQKRAAYGRGFLPATLERLTGAGADPDALLSERDYLFVQPLNGKYARWIKDRVSSLRVFGPFADHFLPVHFHLIPRDGGFIVIPISESAHGYEASVDGVVQFLTDHGARWLQSAGYRVRRRVELDVADGMVQVSGRPFTVAEFAEGLETAIALEPMVIADPVVQDPTLAEAFPNARSAIRMIVTNPGGRHATVTEARIILAERAPHGGAQVLHLPLDVSDGTFRGGRTVINGAVTAVERDPITDALLEGQIPAWQVLRARIEEMCRFVPQLEFAEFSVVERDGDALITAIQAEPSYRSILGFSPETVAFLRDRVVRKQSAHTGVARRVTKWLRNAKTRARRAFGSVLYPAGLVPYQSTRWLRNVWSDLLARNGVPVRDKFWAYRHGFLSYRLPQYGITRENWRGFISDLEYRWLRHLNSSYRYWLTDKISLKYVASQFSDHLPAYYFHVAGRTGANAVVIPMMDCPSQYGETLTGVLALARDLGTLALKPDQGSHGAGFYRLDATSAGFLLNGERASEAEVLAILDQPGSQYLVTEYIRAHPVLAEIYPNAVNTLRLIVFKADGVTPQIGNAYLRIGTAASGAVDNTASGGMFAKVDLETGHFGDAKWLDHGGVSPLPRHPDTGVLIEGELPNWQEVTGKVLEIARALPQLEYLGFDVALTADGFKLPEINRFPDYPRIEKLTPESIAYLLEKVEQKKRVTGYRPGRRLIDLPRRA